MWSANLSYSELCTLAIAAVLTSALATGVSEGAELPGGPGKAETVRVCGKCHLLAQATSLRQAKAGWSQTISKMVDLGAEGTDAEFTAILNYLVKNFGSPNANPSALSPSATAEREASPTIAGAAPSSERPVPADGKITAVRKMGPPIQAAKQWPTYGHDSGGQRFSPLTQITPANVGRLKIAWTYHMRPAGFTGGGRGMVTMEGRGPGGAGGETADSPGGAGRRGMFGSGFRPSGDTPLVINGLMYMSTPYSRVVAVDPVTGKEIWSYQLPSGNPSTRGLEFWKGDTTTPAQVVFGSSDG